jgi:organic hydroperoxide reductase OsmC/OhrA
MDMTSTAHVKVSSQERMTFDVDFGLPGVATLRTDSAPPLGSGAGPDSEMLLVAAVANCMSASLLFALRKYKNDSVAVSACASASVERNAAGKLRVVAIQVKLQLSAPGATLRFVDRAVAQYEDFCTVSQSVKAAIPILVQVVDANGSVLPGQPATAR